MCRRYSLHGSISTAYSAYCSALNHSTHGVLASCISRGDESLCSSPTIGRSSELGGQARQSVSNSRVDFVKENGMRGDCKINNGPPGMYDIKNGTRGCPSRTMVHPLSGCGRAEKKGHRRHILNFRTAWIETQRVSGKRVVGSFVHVLADQPHGEIKCIGYIGRTALARLIDSYLNTSATTGERRPEGIVRIPDSARQIMSIARRYLIPPRMSRRCGEHSPVWPRKSCDMIGGSRGFSYPCSVVHFFRQVESAIQRS